MSGNLLQKYAAGKNTETHGDASHETELLDDLHAFGFLRGIHDRAIMLELRHKDGSIDGFPYAWLSRASFDPSEGITLCFGGEAIKITGRNLNAEARPGVRLFAAIMRHRVPWIQEADGPTMLSARREAIVVERIAIKK